MVKKWDQRQKHIKDRFSMSFAGSLSGLCRIDGGVRLSIFLYASYKVSRLLLCSWIHLHEFVIGDETCCYLQKNINWASKDLIPQVYIIYYGYEIVKRF